MCYYDRFLAVLYLGHSFAHSAHKNFSTLWQPQFFFQEAEIWQGLQGKGVLNWEWSFAQNFQMDSPSQFSVCEMFMHASSHMVALVAHQFCLWSGVFLCVQGSHLCFQAGWDSCRKMTLYIVFFSSIKNRPSSALLNLPIVNLVRHF